MMEVDGEDRSSEQHREAEVTNLLTWVKPCGRQMIDFFEILSS